MKDKTVRILSTRPLDEALVNKAYQNKIILDSISFIRTTDITDISISDQIQNLAGREATLVFTSVNAAKAVIKNLDKYYLQPAWRIYCINGATETFIREHLASAQIVGTGVNADRLSQTLISDKVSEVIFFCGDQRRDELPQQLAKSNIPVEEIVIYETKEIPVKVEKEYDGFLFFSPSAVKSFFAVNSIDPDTVLFSIGTTTALAIKSICDNRVIISGFPSKEALVEVAIKHFGSEN